MGRKRGKKKGGGGKGREGGEERVMGRKGESVRQKKGKGEWLEREERVSDKG